MAVQTDFARLGARLERAAAGRRVVGFDVFDTLIRRRVHPEWVKDAAARWLAHQLGRDADWRAIRQRRGAIEHALWQERVAEGVDGEFTFREVVDRWVAESAAAAGTVPPPGLAAALVAEELQLERRAQEPTPGIADVLARLRARGLRLVFVSDMYLPAAEIRACLDDLGIGRHFSAGYVSCEHGRRKGTGRLFELVLAREGLAPADLLFVGNTRQVDIEPPERLGIPAVHVVDAYEAQRYTRLQIARWSADRNPLWQGHLVREVVESLPRRVRRNGPPGYDLGLVMALPFVAFVLHVMETVRARALREVFFLSREGWLFFRMWRRLRAVVPGGEALPRGRYLFASRIATFLPSMQRLDWPEVTRMWAQYARQTPRLLLANLSLPEDEFAPLVERAGLALDRPVEDPAGDPAFARFLADPEVQRRFTAYRDGARERLRAYLAQIGVFGEGAVGFVDIGWKGSIQANICRALAGDPAFPAVHGLYFARHGELAVPAPSTMTGFLVEPTVSDHLPFSTIRCLVPYELTATATHPSVVGYAAPAERGGRVVPLLQRHHEDHHHVARARGAMAAVDDWLADFLRVADLVEVSSATLLPCALDQLTRYMRYPTRREALLFDDYAHVESFGVHGLTRLDMPPLRAFLGAGGLRAAVARLWHTADRHLWPGLALRRTRLPFAQFAHDLHSTLEVVR